MTYSVAPPPKRTGKALPPGHTLVFGGYQWTLADSAGVWLLIAVRIAPFVLLAWLVA